jgi:hypothetical protein
VVYLGRVSHPLEKPAEIAHELSCRYFGMDAFTLFSWGETFGFLDTKSDIRNLIGSSYKIYPLQTWTRYPPVAWFARHTTLGRRVFARMISRRSDEEGVGLFIDVSTSLNNKSNKTLITSTGSPQGHSETYQPFS